ncbi:hypothetical protein FQN54_001976 [Arachnomyces sp. PD_36]|nr:hypothetical protein FQN54_001976 [Arachnomyces sp. PD_36]
MSLLSRLIAFLGLILLSHAAYSAHEHSTLYNEDIASLPLDIAIETIIGFLCFATGHVLGAEKLKPISWRVWAGQVEKEGGGENPFRVYEERPGFWDVRKHRKEFADWVRGDDMMIKNKQ